MVRKGGIIINKVSTQVTYNEWNELLCEFFFNEQNKNKIIYLYTNENLIEQLGQIAGLAKQEAMNSFCQSVRSYGRGEPDRLFERAYIWGRKWYNQGMIGFPPFIAVLCLTVLAATKMKTNRDKKIGGGNYYFRLRNLLDLEGEGIPPFFKKTKELWGFLVEWQKLGHGEFGYTNVFSFGSKYTGYARSQCLIREKEREELYEFFHWAGYRPNLKIDSKTISEQLELFLTPKISRLSRMFFQDKKGIREAIVNTTLFEYENWDGTNNNLIRNQETFTNSVKHIKKYNLFLRIDKDTKKNFFNPDVKVSFFAIAEEEFFFQDELEKNKLKNFHYKNGTFYKEISIKEIDTISYDQKYIVLDEQLELVFKGKTLFVLRKGIDIGVNAWINRNELIENQEHLIVFRKEKETDVRFWIDKNELPHKNELFANLPEEWRCVIVRINRQETLCNEKIGYNLSRGQDKLTFLDGLKVGNMEWLIDAPPIISILTKPKTTVYINGNALFSLIDGDGLIDFKELNIKNSQIYKISFNNIEKSILLRNNHENLIEFESFEPKKFSDGELTIAGTYIYNSIESYPRPFKQMGYKAYLNNGNKTSTQTIPRFINAMPFNLDRSYLDIGVNFVDFEDNQTDKIRPIDIFFEYLTIKKQGNWDAFLKGIKWCFGFENLGLKAYIVRQKLSQLGFVEFLRDGDTIKYFWKVIPTSVSVLPSKDPIVYLTGGRTRQSIKQLRKLSNSKIKFIFSIPNIEYEPSSIYLLGENIETLTKFLNSTNIKFNWGVDYFAYDLLRCLPVLSDYIKDAPIYSEPTNRNNYWTVKGWDLFSHRWRDKLKSQLRTYSNRFGHHLCLYEISNNEFIKLDREIAKLYLAYQKRLPIFEYKNYLLKIKTEYQLPELYERVLTSCVGQCSVELGNYRVYYNVPHEIAVPLAHKLGFDLRFI
ncbi:hypothetical protein EJF36_12390 [Bacillus sp. HMF5848]|uniref:hypothetical protein n=1 Tax=Bacillus sp. HMF5848 TaxID=2495421 RepID=UPI000F7AAED5|nr:hypothetical protein [Bacillus sp. HMF5848]RSK27610.1 hypothetical protein EJF36_12390 [Bacillus sp. HMF5848]